MERTEKSGHNHSVRRRSAGRTGPGQCLNPTASPTTRSDVHPSGDGKVSLKLRGARLEHKRRVRLGVGVRLDGALHELGRRGLPVVGHHVGRLHRVGGLLHRQRGLPVDAGRPGVVVARQGTPQLVEDEG